MTSRFRTISQQPISVRLYDDQIRELGEVAERHGDQEMSETIRYVVDAYLVYTNQKTIDEEMVRDEIRDKNSRDAG